MRQGGLAEAGTVGGDMEAEEVAAGIEAENMGGSA